MSSPWVVLKFGGTSVVSAERWRVIAERVHPIRQSENGPRLAS